MTSSLAPPWLGALCADWPLVPLRYLVRFLSGGTPDKGNAEFWSGGTIPWVSPKDMKVDRIDDAEDHITEAAVVGSATQLVPIGSVLVVVRGMILAHTLPVAVTTGPVTINQDIKALVCGDRLLPEFLHAVLEGQADWLLSLADSSAHGTKKLETEVLQQFEVPCPPLGLQRHLVEAVRAQASELDNLSAAKQRLLDLLAEKRKAIIATAITRGLAPKVKLHNSGMPWLGQVPTHWDLVPIRYLLSLGPKNGISPQQSGSDGALSFSISAVRDGRVTIEGNEKFVALEREIASAYYLKSGDILLVRGNGNLSLVGTCGLVETAPDECTYPDILMLMRVGERVIAEFLVAAVNSPYVRQQIESLAQTTNGTYKLSGEDVRTLQIALPPLDEQRAIVDHIVRETAKLDAVRAATERTIALLKERRAALIAAAVTGQLDVGAAA